MAVNSAGSVVFSFRPRLNLKTRLPILAKISNYTRLGGDGAARMLLANVLKSKKTKNEGKDGVTRLTFSNCYAKAFQSRNTCSSVYLQLLNRHQPARAYPLRPVLNPFFSKTLRKTV
jgi:hypothetical protein